jgi:hypothetical protein
MAEQPEEPGEITQIERWLATLRGDAGAAGLATTAHEASLLLQAVLHDVQLIDRQNLDTDESEHQRLLFRLRREGLRNRQNVAPAAASRRTGTRLWGVAASVVVAIVLAPLVFPGLGPVTADQEGVRGNTLCIVDSPLTGAAALAKNVSRLGVQPDYFQRCDGSIEWRASSSPALLTLVNEDTHRLAPSVIDGRIQLLFLPPAVSSCSILHAYTDRVHRLRLTFDMAMDR